MKTKLLNVLLAFEEDQAVRTLNLQPLISPARSDSCVIVEGEKKVVVGGVGAMRW